ncbi:MAG TPA: serine hydrolase domain-containing protein [Vicinamibacterales bacterium]|nr:serine hydrolase domain-containing protein [Vicinamibacterales bacterium]
MRFPSPKALFVAVLSVALAVPAAAQEVVRTGPPPAIRALVDGTVTAANGNAEAWEAFAQSKFTPAFLKTQTREQRAAMHAQIAERFGTIAIERVIREGGPDAPLQLHVKGAMGTGVIALHLDEPTATIANLVIASGPPAGGRPETNALPPVPVDPTLTPDEIDRRLRAYFSKLAADDVFSGVALVARNGVPVFMQAYGMSDREKKVSNTIRTRFNIGSINKMFTQLAVRQLTAEGKLAATDTLGKFFPDYPQAASRNATIDQLLNHRGGVADFFGSQFNSAPKDSFATNADYFSFVGSLPPTFAPGERNQYCNGCYIALGAIVEKVSGMPYEKYVAERIFGRAEMTSTGYPRTDRREADMAIGYTRRGGDGTLRSNEAMHGVTGSAAGGGYSTVLDLLTYVKAVKAGRLPGASPDIGIAGGAPGTNAVVESRGEWTVIVLTNFDPPTGERLGVMLADALDR